MDGSAVYSPDSSDSLRLEGDLAYYSGGDYCRDGNFAAEVEQPPVLAATGDGMVAIVVVVLGDRDGVEWKMLKPILVSHGRGAFGDGWSRLE